MISPEHTLGFSGTVAAEIMHSLFVAPLFDPVSGKLLSYDDRVDRLYMHLSNLPQAEMNTRHLITPGLYSRKATGTTGTMLITNTHLKDHQFLMTKGIIWMVDKDSPPKRYEGENHGVTKAGTRRVVYVEEEATFTTFHATKETELPRIEAEIFKECGLMISDNPDHRDFLLMAKELGFEPEQIRIQSRNPHTKIPAPEDEEEKINFLPSHIEGIGTFAKKDLVAGELIAAASINQLRTPAGCYVNHSAKPNAILRAEADGRVNLIASQPITDNTEITLNYRQAHAEARKSHQILNHN